MQLPFLNPSDVDETETGETAAATFRVLADFQDVVDAAADAGLIDDEAAIAFHRQLIAWSRGSAPAVDTSTDDTPTDDTITVDTTTDDTITVDTTAVDTTPDAAVRDIIAAARREADVLIGRAYAEVAQIRSLTLAECDVILEAARAAADRAHAEESVATAG